MNTEMRTGVVLAIVACSAGLATGALASAPPVGPLPAGPVRTLNLSVGDAVTVTLPKPAVAGGVWRVARAFNARVVRQETESTTKGGGVRATYRAVGAGTARVVFAVTRGETSRALAARTFKFVVAKGGAVATRCPRDLLPLPANAIGPAAAAALAADKPGNRPQVTSASLASRDRARGPEVKVRCGTTVWQRTVVVYITDRALLPSESLAQRVLFVGRTASGYRIWQRAH
ncbi:MAG TPA: hypothetical protein VJT84_07680 [Gaiellaceae bacterium]|nr:hypothetical protein [Gaiellaceae bacterium]